MLRAAFALVLAFVLSASGALKVGVVAPLSGDMIDIGTALRNAVTLAHEDNPDFDVELIFEDTHSQLSGIALAAKKLISVDKIDVIFTPYSTETAVVVPLADQANVLHLTCAWNADQVEKSPCTFSNSVSFREYSKATAALSQELGYQRVAVVYHNSPGWSGAVDAIEATFPALGVEALPSLKFSPDLRDFRTPIMKLLEKKPDAVVVYLLPPACDIFIRQLHQLDPSVQVTGYLDIVQERSLLEGATYISEYKPLPEFYARYQARFDHNAQQTLAANAYDLFGMLKQVSSELPEWNVDAAAAAFRSMKDYLGIIGDLTCGPDDVFLAPTHVVTVKEGEKVYRDIPSETPAANKE